MLSDCCDSPPARYFSIIPSSEHFSVETPSTTPLYNYSSSLPSDPNNPLPAFRPPRFSPGALMDASKLLQLQTAASHARPAAQPMQHSTSSSSNHSSSSSASVGSSPSMEPMIYCSRCRRSSTGHGMIKVGTNFYYCRHCASMVGYSAG